ncbi:MAG: DNA replication protein [Alphaproteobacteria bacterium]|nr:DNA replication protein [Alphaproteobacteria bacterium]
MSANQLLLALGHRAARAREDFLVADSNAAAVAWVDRWPDWPGPGLALYGAAGCGKSHLAHVFAARSDARVVGPEAIQSAAVPGLLTDRTAWAIDDADRNCDERGLLHFLNAIAEQRGHVLLTARAAPARWAVALPDLASRLAAMPAVAIAPPNDALLAAVLVKLFADRQLMIGVDVIDYLTGRIERSFAAASAMVERLDRAALAERRAVTVPLVRRVLDTAP